MPIPMLAAAMPPVLMPLLAELSAHDLEMAGTLIGVGRFMLIFVAARALGERRVGSGSVRRLGGISIVR